MKIAVLGTRGIPNRYGGFEQIAEKMSVRWTNFGHEVTVYNPNDHPFIGKERNGVKIKQIFCNEGRLGVLGTNIFDYLCLKDALKQDYDIILELGYSASIFYPSKNKSKVKIVTNMDGLEWKRKKWNFAEKKFLKFLEKQAVLKSDVLIADNPAMQDYFKNTYNKISSFIPYGAEIIEVINKNILDKYLIDPFSYYLLIARLEPENNIEMVLNGYIQSDAKEPFLVVGNINKYGTYLVNKYQNYPLIKFFGGIYNKDVLDNIRYFSKIYFHGHSVGGTNPSLLEAMGCCCFIAAHNNSFNHYILEENAIYFDNSEDITKIIDTYTENSRDKYITNNKTKIKETYNWEKISIEYLDIFK